MSFPPNPISVSFPLNPESTFAAAVPVKVSSFVPPIIPSIELYVSIPCPIAISIVGREPKSIISFAVTSL